MKVNPQTSPLETLEFLLPRCIETLLFLEGKLSDAQLPPWTRKIGRELYAYFPKHFVSASQKDPQQFLEGILFGFSTWIRETPTAIKLGPTEVTRIDRSVRTVDHPSVCGFATKNALGELAKHSAKKPSHKLVVSKLSLPLLSRQAYFYGFAYGLNLERELTGSRFAQAGDRIALRLYLWLRWPEMVETGSVPALYQKCHTAFASKGGAHIVGSKVAFARFCGRYRITFRKRKTEVGRELRPSVSVPSESDNL